MSERRAAVAASTATLLFAALHDPCAVAVFPEVIDQATNCRAIERPEPDGLVVTHPRITARHPRRPNARVFGTAPHGMVMPLATTATRCRVRCTRALGRGHETRNAQTDGRAVERPFHALPSVARRLPAALSLTFSRRSASGATRVPLAR